MRTQALQYDMHDGPGWRTASSVIGDRLLTSVAEEPRKLFARCTRFPLHASLLLRPALVFMMAASVFSIDASAATLKPETVADWEEYLQTTNSALDGRCRSGGTFLWVDESPERLAKVRDGEIVVGPAADRIPMKVRGGLIHHWIGAAFLPDTKVEDILDVIRDYDRYKVFYSPSVVESRVLARNASEERFTMQLVNHEFFSKMALDADYRVTNVQLDPGRFYSIARTTRVQQLEDYGQPREHMLPEGQGGGYIWKLYSVVRLQHRDGGVYVEMETIALSRGIPAAFRMIADPIVRRVSRGAMLTAIKQTEDAVQCNSLTAVKPATCPASRTASAVTARRVQ